MERGSSIGPKTGAMFDQVQGQNTRTLTWALETKPVNETELRRRCLGAVDERVARTNILGKKYVLHH